MIAIHYAVHNKYLRLFSCKFINEQLYIILYNNYFNYIVLVFIHFRMPLVDAFVHYVFF